MSSPADLLLAAATQAASVVAPLLEAARHPYDDGPAAELWGQEIPELLCDALKLTLEAVAAEHPEPEGREIANQLLAACARFIEGWA